VDEEVLPHMLLGHVIQSDLCHLMFIQLAFSWPAKVLMLILHHAYIYSKFESNSNF